MAGPGIEARGDGLELPTSHIDVVPTLLGLVGSDQADLIGAVGAHHTEAHPLPGRDLSGLLRGGTESADIAGPIYFMTEDQISRGLRTESPVTHTPFEAVGAPSSVETVIAEIDGVLWKLNHYYDADGVAEAEDWELHDLSTEPEERTNRFADSDATLNRLRELMSHEREHKRIAPKDRLTPG